VPRARLTTLGTCGVTGTPPGGPRHFLSKYSHVSTRRRHSAHGRQLSHFILFLEQNSQDLRAVCAPLLRLRPWLLLAREEEEEGRTEASSSSWSPSSSSSSQYLFEATLCRDGWPASPPPSPPSLLAERGRCAPACWKEEEEEEEEEEVASCRSLLPAGCWLASLPSSSLPASLPLLLLLTPSSLLSLLLARLLLLPSS